MSETLFLVSDGPGPGDFLDATDGVPTIATGVSFTVTATGTITAIRFYATTNAATGGGNYTVNLFEVTGDDDVSGAHTLLGSSVSVPAASIVSGVWNEVPLTSPVTVQPGHAYRASLHSGTSGRYVATTGYFVGVDHTSAGGHIIAHHNGDNPVGFGTVNNGVFTINPDDPHMYPFHTTGANYWIDVVADFSTNVAGSGSAALGALVAAGAGLRSKAGAGVASLGGVHAVGTVPPRSTVVPRPSTGTITRPNAGVIQRPTRAYP